MQTMTLSDAEVELILERRQVLGHIESLKIIRLKLLTVALDYEKWLQNKGRISTFSTFANEFGCDDAYLKDDYYFVEKIRGCLPNLKTGDFNG